MSPSPAAPSQGQTQGPAHAEGSLMHPALNYANDPVMGRVTVRVDSLLGVAHGAIRKVQRRAEQWP